MRNSQQPPKYGAEGPPGGVNAWASQRMGQNQSQPQGMSGFGQMVRGMVDRSRVQQGGQPPMPGGPPPGGPPGGPPQDMQPPQGMQQGMPQRPQMPQQQTGMAGLGQMMRAGANRISPMMAQAAALRNKGQQQ